MRCVVCLAAEVAHAMNTSTRQLATASALLLISVAVWAQTDAPVTIQPSDDDAKPFTTQGIEVSQMLASDKSNNRVFLKLDVAARTATFTEFSQTAKGELERLKVSSVQPAKLRSIGEFGTRVEAEENDYFGGKVHVIVLTCEGANVACIGEQDYSSVNGGPLKKDTQTFFKAHFRSGADAERVLAEVMKLR